VTILISGVASTIAGLVQLTMSGLVDRTERGGAPFPPGMSPKRRWQVVDLTLGVLPALLLVQPLMALAAQRRAERDEAAEAEGEDVESAASAGGERGALTYPLLAGDDAVNIARQTSHISIASMANSVASIHGAASLRGADRWDIYASSHASPALHSGSYLASAQRSAGTGGWGCIS
jgi:hypothetical protein